MAGILEAKPRVGYTYIGEGEVEALSSLKELRVGDVLAAPLVVAVDTTAYDALVTMMLEDQGTVFVVNEEGFLARVVSRRDLLRLSLGRTDFNNVPVGLIMTRASQVVSITAEESIFSAAQKLTTYRIDVLPVVRSAGDTEDQQELLGRISRSTITRLFSELGEKIS